MISGGARAGKSSFALHLAREREAATAGSVCFIATAEAIGDEMRKRIVNQPVAQATGAYPLVAGLPLQSK